MIANIVSEVKIIVESPEGIHAFPLPLPLLKGTLRNALPPVFEI